MSRLIDADALKLGIERYLEKILSHKFLPIVKNAVREVGNDMIFAIDAQPTIDAVPVVHGHWIGWSGEKMVDYYNETYKKIHGYRCSNCNRNTAVKSKYCSCCGALMDEVTNNVQTN